MSGLVCRGLTKSFPGVKALRNVDLDVEPGRVLVLLGENGAGKSTLVKTLSGVHRPDSGMMLLDDVAYEPESPAAAISAGVGMIHQEMNLVPGLSVAENIYLGREPMRMGCIDYGRMYSDARAQLSRVGLSLSPRTQVSKLSVAAQQQVEITKALSLNAQILVLDEPTASLGAEESAELFRIIDELKAQGVGIIYISHRLKEVARVGDTVVVLRDGERIRSWSSADVDVDEFVVAMVGRDVDQVYPDPPPPSDEVILEVRNLSSEGAFEDISFELRKGEVLGIAGLVGAGRTELARALFGVEPPTGGQIRIAGESFVPKRPAEAVERGLVLVPEDRKAQGLAQGLSLGENLVLPQLRDFRGRVVRPSWLRRQAAQLSERLGVKGRPQQSARTLSGGNQQKAVIAKWLPQEPRIMIFDEPTRGVDVGSKAAIYEVIRDLAAGGVGVIVISSELPEVLGLANRVLVLASGRQTALFERGDATEEAVMAKAVNR